MGKRGGGGGGRKEGGRVSTGGVFFSVRNITTSQALDRPHSHKFELTTQPLHSDPSHAGTRSARRTRPNRARFKKRRRFFFLGADSPETPYPSPPLHPARFGANPESGPCSIPHHPNEHLTQGTGARAAAQSLAARRRVARIAAPSQAHGTHARGRCCQRDKPPPPPPPPRHR